MGQRAAAVMSLIQSARMNGHDPYAYLKDVLTRLPMHKASRINELLPQPQSPVTASVNGGSVLALVRKCANPAAMRRAPRKSGSP